jgi:hypothetical protein
LLLRRQQSPSFQHWSFHSRLTLVPHGELLTIIIDLPSRAFVPVGKARAIEAPRLVVISNTVHPIAQALQVVDNHLPICQTAGELPY